MKELYWISVLGSLKIVCLIAVPIFITFAVVAYVAYMNAHDENNEKDMAFNIKWIKRLLVGFVLSLLGTIFIPSSQELYIIYGVGSVIDYLKELPDNIVNFLNELLLDK